GRRRAALDARDRPVTRGGGPDGRAPAGAGVPGRDRPASRAPAAPAGRLRRPDALAPRAVPARAHPGGRRGVRPELAPALAAAGEGRARLAAGPDRGGPAALDHGLAPGRWRGQQGRLPPRGRRDHRPLRRDLVAGGRGRGAVRRADRGRGPGRAGLTLTTEAQSGLRLAHAAIRRRKAVIVIDLAGSAHLAESLAAACAEPGAPLSCFGPAGPGCYEPLRGGGPARAAALVMALRDWSETGDQQRRSCAAYLTDALAVQAVAPRDRGVPVLDDLVCLLTPAGLRERAALIPAYHPRRDVLADRAAVSADLLDADPATVAAPAAQLPWLRSSALGQWLRPPPPGAARISLRRSVRERGVTLFSTDPGGDGRAARMIGALAAADLMTVCAELAGMSVPGDGLVWISGCEVLGQLVLAELIARGRGAGMAMVLGTAS